ncbi:MAG TPA: TrmH family RNA methyltransferase [Sphaerochaeta sp.]|nr:TrmH family RNA methyltransferase [Sphaerochaeta sp.]
MKWQEQLERIQVVLVEPQDGANIGAVCRAMKTMRITRLAVVGERQYSEERVKMMAVHAYDIWENSLRYPTLATALENSVLSVALTRRRGKLRKDSVYSPEQLAQRINQTPEGPVSLVFGRESDGLTVDEVALCTLVTTITTSEEFPSLNLAQSVQIITYELYKNLRPMQLENIVVSQKRCEEAAELCIEALHATGYFKFDHEGLWTYRFLKDLLNRATLNEKEIDRFEKIFSKMSNIVRSKKEQSDV